MKEKKFKLPLISRTPREIDPNEDKTPNIKYYFKSLWRKFSKLLSINLMMLFQVFPVLIGVLAYYLWMPRIPVFTDTLYPTLYGIHTITNSAISTTLINAFGMSIEVSTVAFGGAAIVILICALFLLITYGWQNVGSSYLMRELVRERPVFVFSDYFYAVKKNLKQGFILGVVDFLITAVLVFDFFYFYKSFGTSILYNLMFWCVCGVSVIYLFMHFYIYLMQINFDISIRKIFKNALIFTALGFKRNILAVLWILVVAAVNIALFILLLPMNIIVPAVLPFFYFAGFALFTTTYAAYPIIKKFMIDPYYDEYGNPKKADTATKEGAEAPVPPPEKS